MMAQRNAGMRGVKRGAARGPAQPPRKRKFPMNSEMRMKKQLHIGSNELGYEMKANYINVNAMDKIFKGQLWMTIKKKITSRLIDMYAGEQTFKLICDLTYAYRKIYPVASDCQLIRETVEELQKAGLAITFVLTDEHLLMDDGSPEITEKLFNESPAARELNDEMYYTKDQLSRAVDQKSAVVAEKLKKFMAKHQPHRPTSDISSESLRVVDCMLHRMKNDFKGIVSSALLGISARPLNDVIGKPLMIYFEPRMVSREVRSGYLTSMGASSVQLPRTIHNLALAHFDNIQNYTNMLRANGTMLGGSRILVRAPRPTGEHSRYKDRDEQGEGDDDCDNAGQQLHEDSYMDGSHFEDNDDDGDLRPDEY